MNTIQPNNLITGAVPLNRAAPTSAPEQTAVLDKVLPQAHAPQAQQLTQLRRHAELTLAAPPEPAPTPEEAKAEKAVEAEFEHQLALDLKAVHRETNGSFTRADIDEALKNPDLHGDQAAALGVIADNFDDMAKAHDGKFIRADDVKKAHLGDKYTEDVEYLKTASHDVFNGKPDYHKMDQGGIGDCYFLSPLDNEARLHPDALVNRVKDNGTTVTVDIPGRHSETVAKPTDAQIVAYAGGGSNGIWPTCFELAWEASQHPKLSVMDEPGADAVVGIQAASGHGAVNEDNDKLSLAHIDKRLKAFPPSQFNVCASTADREYKNGLIEDHVYSVVNYDPKSKMITIRNPWGSGVPTGYEEKNPGEFTMKLKDFKKEFADLTTEDRQHVAALGPPPDDSAAAAS